MSILLTFSSDGRSSSLVFHACTDTPIPTVWYSSFVYPSCVFVVLVPLAKFHIIVYLHITVIVSIIVIALELYQFYH